MNTVRSARAFRRDRLQAVCALLGLALLAACDGARVAQAAEDSSAIPTQKIDSICDRELSYDVTGPYYHSCRNYLRRHVQAQPAAVNAGEPAEHRACEQIGLPQGTLDWRRCVQELYQLDVSAAHL
jgi:hypothetical protein